MIMGLATDTPACRDAKPMINAGLRRCPVCSGDRDRYGRTVDVQMHPLVAEAMKKAPLVWVEPDGHGSTPAWCVWHEGSAYVVSGPGEQPVPGLAGAARCQVVVRSGDTLARILRWTAAVTTVEPGTPEWDAIVPTLLPKRLNLADAENAPARWAAECRVSRLTPDGPPDEVGDTLPTASGAAAPPATPAATRVTVPYTIGRPRGRRRQH
jgi:hypothetical protein